MGLAFFARPMSLCSSEVNFQPELQLPWEICSSGLTKSSGSYTVVGRAVRSGQLEVCPVEQVERLGAELDTNAFRNPDILKHRHIRGEVIWAYEGVAA